jgi:hypothetical protein
VFDGLYSHVMDLSTLKSGPENYLGDLLAFLGPFNPWKMSLTEAP